MYTRSRQPQGGQQNFNQGQRQMSNQSGQFQGQAAYTQQGNYSATAQKSQGNYTGNVQNSQQFKQQQPQQQSQPQVKQQQQMQAKPPMQQQPQMMQQNKPQQQQQQQPQQAQQQATPQPQRLKPILKQAGPGNTQQIPQQQGNMAQQQGNMTPQQPQQQQQQQQQVNMPQHQQQQLNNAEGIKSEGDFEKMDLEDGDQQEPVRRWKRKAPGLKINRKLKRMRMNQRLRKTLQPKNAIMVLNEMKTGVQFTFPESQASLNSSLFLVHAEIDGKTYVGQGLSKPLARQNAAENALKSLLLEKMTAASMKARIDAESDGQNQSLSTADNSDGGNENSDGNASMDTSEEADEIPWSSLASFALYKLFLEWQNQGTVVPVPRPGVSPGKVKKDHNKPVVQKELPANATTIHPVMLLNQMRPGLTYVESNREGNPPNTVFTLSIEVDGVEYRGTAKNKRDAKKAAAKAALKALYDLTYPEEAA